MTDQQLEFAVIIPAVFMLALDIIICYRGLHDPIRRSVQLLFRDFSVACVLQQGAGVAALFCDYGYVPGSTALQYLAHTVILTAMTLTANCWSIFFLPGYERVVFERHLKVMALIPTELMLLLCLTTRRTHWVFYIDEKGKYCLGSLWALQFLMPVLCVIIAVVHMLWKKADRLKIPHEIYRYFFSFLIPVFCGVFLEIRLFHGGYSSYGVSLGVLFMYLQIYVDEIRENAVIKNELEVARLKVSSDQMQPHFLYNALGAIREIVLDRPEYAAQLLMNFSTFLRACFKNMSEETLVPISEEIENINAYTEIEKIRMGDRLRVHTDIADRNFSVVPLSVQPLVENAIRHGIFPRGKEGGDVYIITAFRDGMHEITVRDNGVGFDYEKLQQDIKVNRRDSTGLQNTRFRLESVMNAEFRVESTPGEGTVITVRIPAKEKHDQYIQ